MKKFKSVLVAVALLAISAIANAQLIYGNTFPFWNVNGPLTVTGTTTLSGTTNVTGALATTSPAITTSITTPSTTFALVNTTATTVNFAGAATALNIGAATGTVTVGPAIVGSIATDSTSSVTGAWKTAGGLGVAKALFVGTTTTTPTLVVSTSTSPASNAACTAGNITWDASYIYVCTATGVVKRAALTGGY